MYRTISLLAVIFMSVAACDSEISSEWLKSPITVDGKAEDWNKLSLWYFDEEGISLGVANSKDNLYFLLETDNPQLAKTLRHRGFTIWLDPSGEKLKSFGLRILGREKPASHLEMALLIENILTFVPAGGKLGPAAQSSQEFGNSIYEIKVPIKASDSARYHVSCLPDAEISLGFELELPEKMGKPKKRAKGPQVGRGRGMGMGRGGRGIHGGGKDMGGMSPANDSKLKEPDKRRPDKDRKSKPKLEKKEIWLKLTLALEGGSP
jgi:hypothetical protein